MPYPGEEMAGIEALNGRMFEDCWIEQDHVCAVMEVFSIWHG